MIKSKLGIQQQWINIALRRLLHILQYREKRKPFLCLSSIDVETYCFTSHRSSVRPISFVSVRSLRTGGQARDVDPMPYCWPTVYDAQPTLAQYWTTVSCLTPHWMWASVTDGRPTLTQPWFQLVVILWLKPCMRNRTSGGVLLRVQWREPDNN